MSYINYSYQNLKTFCHDAFMKFGFSNVERALNRGRG